MIEKKVCTAIFTTQVVVARLQKHTKVTISLWTEGAREDGTYPDV